MHYSNRVTRKERDRLNKLKRILVENEQLSVCYVYLLRQVCFYRGFTVIVAESTLEKAIDAAYNMLYSKENNSANRNEKENDQASAPQEDGGLAGVDQG